MTAADGYPRLLGDVGATHARWVWQAAPCQTLPAPRIYRCDDFSTEAAIRERRETAEREARRIELEADTLAEGKVRAAEALASDRPGRGSHP